MTISILPLTFPDIPHIVSLSDTTFSNDPLRAASLPPNTTPSQLAERTQWRIRNKTERFQAPNNHYFKAVDSQTSELVGYVAFHGPKPEGYVAPARYGGRPSWMREEGMEGAAGKLAEAKREVFGEDGARDVWYIQSLSVAPEYQGRGIASQLLQHGIREVVGDAECFTESTPVAVKTYERAGFEKRLRVEMLEEGEGYGIWIMVRPGKKTS